MVDRRELMYPSNLLSISRMVLLPLLYFMVFFDATAAFIVTYVIIGSTDYFDGKIARRRNEVTDIGKTLDSIADIMFYLSSAYFAYHFFRAELMWNFELLMLFFAIFFLSFIVSAIRFGKPMLMHTNLLRFNAVLVYLTIIFGFFLGGFTKYLIFTVLLIYLVAFTEEILIFMIYGEVDPDVRFIWHLMRKDD